MSEAYYCGPNQIKVAIVGYENVFRTGDLFYFPDQAYNFFPYGLLLKNDTDLYLQLV